MFEIYLDFCTALGSAGTLDEHLSALSQKPFRCSKLCFYILLCCKIFLLRTLPDCPLLYRIKFLSVETLISF